MSDENKPRTYRTRRPMLVGFLLGLLSGVCAALIVAMYVNRIASPFVNQSRANGAARPAAEKAPAPSDSIERQMASIAGPGAAALMEPGKAPKSAKKPVLPPAPVDTATSIGAGRYYLQVGSFVSLSDADNRKAKLALLGHDAAVRSISLPDKGMMHRVVVGPFESLDELDQVKEELRENGYAASLLSRQNLSAAGTSEGTAEEQE